jgi:hypothetical protein
MKTTPNAAIDMRTEEERSPATVKTQDRAKYGDDGRPGPGRWQDVVHERALADLDPPGHRYLPPRECRLRAVAHG